jgi:UDP-2,3-diacylglucosamine hydrolase
LRRIFISDLHLQEPISPAFLRFQECLEVEACRNEEIFILGDLVEMWVGDDDDSACASAVIDTLASVKECALFVMHGNRDFLLGDDFASRSGVQVISDPTLLADGTLVTHGDRYCTDDAEYQSMRAWFRSSAWQEDILGKTLDERKSFGEMLRAQSAAANSNKAANIMDVNLAQVSSESAKYSAKKLIHGHTHRPGKHQDPTRYVLGAWDHVGWLCRQHDDEVTLECFSLARRYGT